MAHKVEQTLIEPLFHCLQKERFITISIDFKTGAPNVSVISWVYAPNEERSNRSSFMNY